jgi:hypothetical protein
MCLTVPEGVLALCHRSGGVERFRLDPCHSELATKHAFYQACARCILKKSLEHLLHINLSIHLVKIVRKIESELCHVHIPNSGAGLGPFGLEIADRVYISIYSALYTCINWIGKTLAICFWWTRSWGVHCGHAPSPKHQGHSHSQPPITER